MSILVRAVFLAFFCELLCLPAYAANVGPYSGCIIDAVNNKPIEGVSVFMYWTSIVEAPVPANVSEKLLSLSKAEREVAKKYFMDHKSDVRLVNSNSKGEYLIPRLTIKTGYLGYVETLSVVVYQPGYQAYIKSITLSGPYAKQDSEFQEKHNRIKLQRIPDKFDYRKHYESIENSLNGIYDSYSNDMATIEWESLLQMKLRAFPEKNELLRRAEWEQRRSYEDMEK
jgi:hypothetical protein